MTGHGYSQYTHGCRCDICRAAKREYQRAFRERRHRIRRRVEGRSDEAGRNYVDGIKHGYAGYQDYSCRCEVCRSASSAACRRYYQRSKVATT